ncbi:hypothetical protein [Aquihabitans sp. McL0605]|uniref:hypothetical protein n=1 Tax=Aquihabitans sp. McL0605 TaxID=3415671 RepID=UPI003CF1359D
MGWTKAIGGGTNGSCPSPTTASSGSRGRGPHQDRTGHPAGWGIVELDSQAVGGFKATQIVKVVETFPPSVDGTANHGSGSSPTAGSSPPKLGNQTTGTATAS